MGFLLILGMIIPDTKDLFQNFQKAQMITLPGMGDSLGKLHFWENKELFPNGILRCFWITEVQEGISRGSHAHFMESQVLVALAGRLKVKVEGVDGSEMDFELSQASHGVFVPPMNWVEVWFEQGAVLLGMSDREFSENDYIRDKGKFEELQQEYR